jgi:ribose 1,5-bisphosphokinase PhnN
VSAPAPVLARRLAARAREDALARDGRLARAIGTPTDADLTVVNDRELQQSVATLLRWWNSVRDAD